MTPTIKSRVLKTAEISWQNLSFLQPPDFKSWQDSDKAKLKQSILADMFNEPFYVWEEPGGCIYCLDGYHRTIVLKELKEEGIEVPDQLPATFISCSDRREAAKLVLQYSTAYARITYPGFTSFLEAFCLNLPELEMTINLPEMAMIQFDGADSIIKENQELDTDAFKDEMFIKLKYTRDEYFRIKERMTTLMTQNKIETPEALFTVLLFPHETDIPIQMEAI